MESKKWSKRGQSVQGRSPQEPSGTRVGTREQAKKNQPETRLVFQYGGLGSIE